MNHETVLLFFNQCVYLIITRVTLHYTLIKIQTAHRKKYSHSFLPTLIRLKTNQYLALKQQHIFRKKMECA